MNRKCQEFWKRQNEMKLFAGGQLQDDLKVVTNNWALISLF